MLYQLQQGPTEQHIIKQCLREGTPFPKAIQDAPDLWPGLELFYTSWVELDSCRSLGLSVGPIYWNAVEDYSNALGLDLEQRADLHYHIRKLDQTFLDWQKK